MLQWIFGAPEGQKVYVRSHDRASGTIRFSNANIRWFLSINAQTLPQGAKDAGKKTFRSLTFNQWSFDFSEGFTDLHTASYDHILNGGGFSEVDAQNAIAMVHEMRELPLSEWDNEAHELAALPLAPHPFKKNR
jgi:UDP-N-acetyl-2-amino-2-deoxyglucuronate dehydrogenase